jgi:3-phosphoinositide dependent protein kinase-1
MVSSGKSKIIISGLVDKKVGFLIYKARQLILNDSEPPKLTYYDP